MKRRQFLKLTAAAVAAPLLPIAAEPHVVDAKPALEVIASRLAEYRIVGWSLRDGQWYSVLKTYAWDPETGQTGSLSVLTKPVKEAEVPLFIRDCFRPLPHEEITVI